VAVQLSVLKVAKDLVRSTLQTVNSELAGIAANAQQVSKNIKIMQKKTDENGNRHIRRYRKGLL